MIGVNRYERLERLISEVDRLILRAISLQAEIPSKAEQAEIVALSSDYQDWYAKILALLSPDLIVEFRKQYEGGPLSVGIRAFLVDPIRKSPLYRDDLTNSGGPQAFPWYQVPVERGFVNRIEEQRLLLRRARELEAESETSSTPPVAQTSLKPVIFIGHSQNLLYFRVAEHIRKLSLDVELFEGESRTAKQIVEVLEQMLSRPNAAVILMTGDDTTDSGKKRARQNVVHELGLFQGRLGFERVAILVQSGVELPTNIDGLQQIRFREQEVQSVFPELDNWLEQLKLLKPRPSD